MPKTRRKRDHWNDKSNSGKKKRARGMPAETKDDDKQATLPQSVFPLIWNFLLEPSSQEVDPESMMPLLDLKSIQSFMLVSKDAKEAFHACNGWSMCRDELKREADIKEEHLKNFENEALSFGLRESLTDDELSRCHFLSSKVSLMRSVNQRLVALRNNFLPAAKRLANNMPLRKDDGDNLYRILSDPMGLDASIAVLHGKITLEHVRRQLAESNAFLGLL